MSMGGPCCIAIAACPRKQGTSQEPGNCTLAVLQVHIVAIQLAVSTTCKTSSSEFRQPQYKICTTATKMLNWLGHSYWIPLTINTVATMHCIPE